MREVVLYMKKEFYKNQVEKTDMQFSNGNDKEWKDMDVPNDFSTVYETGQKHLSSYWQKLGFHYSDDKKILYKNIESHIPVI